MFEYSYKTIQSLKYAKHRKKYNKYVIEGKRLIKSALEFKVNIGPLFCSNNFIKENEKWLKENIQNKKQLKKLAKNKF